MEAQVTKGHQRFTDEAVLAALRAAYEETGRIPTVTSWRSEGRRPTPTAISARFGSWSKALQLAGLPVSGKSAGIPSRRARTRERHLSVLREVAARHGGPITMRRWDAEGIRPTARAIVIRFGSWRRAWEAAGFATASWSPWRRIADEEILARMREAAEKTGRALTASEWRAAGLRPNAQTIVRRFGSWAAAWREAGVGNPHDRESLLETVRARLAAGGLTRAQRLALEAVAETGSEVAAAKRLGVTHQAISLHVRRALRRPPEAAVWKPVSLDAVRARLEASGLTPRLREILGAVLRCGSASQAAVELGVHVNTVYSAVRRAMKRQAEGGRRSPIVEAAKTRLEAGGLTERQRQVLESIVRCGSVPAAATELKMKASSLYATVYRILGRPAGRVPRGETGETRDG